MPFNETITLAFSDVVSSTIEASFTTLQNSTHTLGLSGRETLPHHRQMMPYLWTLVIDVAIFFAFYRHTKYSLVLHALIALFVSLTTAITALPMLIDFGMPKQETKTKQQRHRIIAVTLLSGLALQILLGAVSRTLQFMKWGRSSLVYRINCCHKYWGYAMVILGKVQVYLILNFKEDDLFVKLLIPDLFLIVAGVVRKLYWPTLAEKILPHNSKGECRQISSLSEVKDQYPNAGVFANYVYDLKALMKTHPIGYNIIDTVKDRQLDRYLYGMYRSQRQPSIPTNMHGYRAFTLAGKPVAKLVIPSVYYGLDKDFVKVQIFKVREISAKGDIYEIEFKSNGPEAFEFKGYESVEQLGRYFSLTMDKKVSRLYTTVGFLTPANVSFLKSQCFKELTTHFTSISKSITSSSSSALSLPIMNSDSSENDSRCLKVMMKKYVTGMMSEHIVDGSFEDLWLSASRGQGLRFRQLQPGHIIIVAGGTGLFPFCDLIDLLYKSFLLSSRPQLKQTILSNDPILKNSPFKQFSFELYLAVTNLEDIHPLILSQLNELVKDSQKFRWTLRVNEDVRHQLHQNVVVTTERFSESIIEKVREGKFEKIWVCGPPTMNEDMINMLDKQNLDQSRYLIL